MRKTAFLLLVMTMVMAGFNSSQAQSQKELEERAVIYATMQFYTALEGEYKDKPEIISEMWSQGDDVTYMGADGGYDIGWAAAYSAWQTQSAKHFPIKVQPTNLVVTVGPELAVAHNYVEAVTGKADSAKGTSDIKLRATTVFRKENGKWKVIGHHVDAIPMIERSTTKSE